MSDLLELALRAHGGLARWEQVTRLDVRASLNGMLYSYKGRPQGVTDVVMTVDPRKPGLVISPYGGDGRRGHFTPDRVWISDAEGRAVDERRDPLASFAGHRLETPWDALHALYFTSYAMWNYLTTPFMLTLPGFRTREIEPHVENGDTWRRLQVMFPEHIPTHNSFRPGGEQTFYFSEQGLLQRLDYDAVGPASHYTFDHTTYDGLVFPTLRRVVRRAPSGPLINGPTAVLIQIASVEVH